MRQFIRARFGPNVGLTVDYIELSQNDLARAEVGEIPG
jgi:hypothetical protein